MPVVWSDEVDEILGNDLAAALAYATPAKGVVVTLMAPLGIRDRDRGTVTLSTSLGLPKKLRRDGHEGAAWLYDLWLAERLAA